MTEAIAAAASSNTGAPAIVVARLRTAAFTSGTASPMVMFTQLNIFVSRHSGSGDAATLSSLDRAAVYRTTDSRRESDPQARGDRHVGPPVFTRGHLDPTIMCPSGRC